MTNPTSIGRDVLSFLFEQQLDPNPKNYRLGYLYLAKSNKSLTDEIDDHLAGGMRIRQADVAYMLQQHDKGDKNDREAADGLVVTEEDKEAVKAEAAIDTFVTSAISLMKDTQSTAGDLAKTLRKENQKITPELDASDLHEIVGRIMAQSREAEKSIVEAANRIERLQIDLNEARNTALIDDLTGLPNRRAARQVMERQDQDQERYGIAILDIDHFKRVNDNFGHPVGDRLIRHISTILAETMSGDMVARWGGEEFIVITKNSLQIHTFQQRLEEAARRVSNDRLKVRETDKQLGTITISGGIAETTGDHETAVKIADDELYKAKNGGRNKILFAGRS